MLKWFIILMWFCGTQCLLTYFWFVQQAHDEAKGPEVSNQILRITFYILLIEQVNECLKSQK